MHTYFIVSIMLSYAQENGSYRNVATKESLHSHSTKLRVHQEKVIIFLKSPICKKILIHMKSTYV